MIRYLITDRRVMGGVDGVRRAAERAIAPGASWIQVREKDLPARELLSLIRGIQSLPGADGVKILVNSRADVALAAGCAGVHLPSDSPDARAIRRVTPPGFLIGVSCHTVGEVARTGVEGADYAMFGPVFPPLSKESPLAPRGLAGLRLACRAARVPVFAVGGITAENEAACAEAGAAGVAGITLFAKILV